MKYIEKYGVLMDRVCIYMSTYNGQDYLQEQIDSILAQKDVEVYLIIRDDGSTDNTIAIINNYLSKNHNILLIDGENIGCEASFMELLHYDFEADYYAFADQDDVWDSDKVISEIEMIKDYDIPAVCGCNLLACDKDLNPIREVYNIDTLKKMEIIQSKIIFTNMHGCVLLWNKKLDILLKQFWPDLVVSHDVWVCAVAHVVGVMKIDYRCHIKYRIHEKNVSGLALNIFYRLKKGIKIYLGEKHPEREKIAQQLLMGYEKYMSLDSDGYRIAKLLAEYKLNIKKKIELLNSNLIKSNSYPDKLFWKICVLLGKY